MHELLARFRSITTPKSVKFPKKAEMQQALARIEAKLHLCAYLSELVNFFGGLLSQNKGKNESEYEFRNQN